MTRLGPALASFSFFGSLAWVRVGPLEGGLPDSAPGPVEWLTQLGGGLFWVVGGFGEHVCIFEYDNVYWVYMCIFFMYICSSACVCFYVCENSFKKAYVLAHIRSTVLCISRCK